MHIASSVLRIGSIVVALAGCSTAGGEPQNSTQTVNSVMSKRMYAHSTLGILVADQASGARLVDRMDQKVFVPGSIMKTYSIDTAQSSGNRS